jgi:hypothetical protein
MGIHEEIHLRHTHGYFLLQSHHILFSNHIGGVMNRLLAACAVESGFELLSGMTKDYEIGICCLSAQHTNLRGSTWLFFIANTMYV